MKIVLVILMLTFAQLSIAQVNVLVRTPDGEKVFAGYEEVDGSFVFNAQGDKEISMATLDWAPYIGKDICGQGWVQQLVVSAFIRQGYKVRTYFVPWKRAVLMAESGKVDVLYPEYVISDSALSDIHSGVKRLDLLELSESFEGGAVAFWRRKDSGVVFNGDLLSLKKVSIGVVAGYENTPEFDALMDQKYFPVSPAVDDWVNVKKLYRKRIQLIVGDPLVLEFAIRQNLSPVEAEVYLSELETVTPHLATHPLYLAFSNKREGYLINKAIFNQSLSQMQSEGEIARIRNSFQSRAHLDRYCQVDM